MSLTTTTGTRLTRGQSAQMPALLEFYSPSASLMETRPQVAARGVIWTVCSMFAACTIAAAMVPIDKVVTTTAKLVATQDTLVVQPFETSIVREIDVQEGETVHKGQLPRPPRPDDPRFGSDRARPVRREPDRRGGAAPGGSCRSRVPAHHARHVLPGARSDLCAAEGRAHVQGRELPAADLRPEVGAG